MRVGSFAVVIAVLCGGAISAQEPAAKPDAQAACVPTMTFDVASIRAGKLATDGSMTVSAVDPPHSSLLRLTNHSVPNLLAVAYGVNFAQIVGLPDWARSPYSFFDVEAKSDASVDEKLAKLTDEQARLEKQHMMQVLLADRFQLKVHWETKEGPVYDLVVAKTGPKLHPGGSITPTTEDMQFWGDKKIPSIYQRGNGIKGYEYIGHECSLESLAEALTVQMGEPVIDKTGLTETYDFILQYRGRGPDASEDPDVWPPLLTAVPDQLGLKLQPAKAETQFLVIDHMERPSAN